MTTNNHPAHGPVSLNRLLQISEILSKAAAQSDGGNLGYAMADAVKVIDGVIAAFGAEPVAWIAKKKTTGEMELDEPHAKATNPKYWTDAFPVYTTPQAPVVPDEIDKWQAIDDIRDHDESFRWDSADGYEAGWNACLAAMLQLYGNSEQLDEVGSWNNHRNTPTAQADNSLVTPDCWIPVSERMPEAEGRYWCYVEEQNCLGKSHYQWNCSWNGDRWWVESDNGGCVTHWMELPAAPQQEVKR